MCSPQSDEERRPLHHEAGSVPQSLQQMLTHNPRLKCVCYWCLCPSEGPAQIRTYSEHLLYFRAVIFLAGSDYNAVL